jgi:hypothetical protein
MPDLITIHALNAYSLAIIHKLGREPDSREIDVAMDRVRKLADRMEWSKLTVKAGNRERNFYR